MADLISKTDVFKFVALRPPVSIDKKKLETNFIADIRVPEQTPVGRLVKEIGKKDGALVYNRVKEFVKANKYEINYPENEAEIDFKKIYDIAASPKENFKIDEYRKDIENLLDAKIEKFLDKNQKILDGIWDRYYAFYILARTENQNLDVLTRNLRVFHVLKNIPLLKNTDAAIYQNLLIAKPLVSALFTDLPLPTVKNEQPKAEKPNPEKIREYKNLWNDLVNTNRAIEEIKNLKFDSKIVTDTTNITNPNRKTGIETKSKLTSVHNLASISKKGLEGLNTNTKSILKELNISENFQISEPIAQLQDKFQQLYNSASAITDEEFLKAMPMEAKSISGLATFWGKVEYKPLIPFIPKTNIRSLIKPLGIGDLKVVKQTIKKYATGEVAHIENVLRGESKERDHRVLDRTEDIFTFTNETEEETTKDTQTTDRFELKKESENTVQEQMSVQAGVTVSGSYGVVTFGAHGDFAYSTSSTESSKNSSNFAREVVDKSVSKIQKRTKEERTTKKLHEVEEINKHGIDNSKNPDHTTGIYRWVDKYYEAQIYNYGKRMMFEFIIPEPAAFYAYAQTHKPKKNIIPPKTLPTYLTHKNITEYNYQDFIRDYNIQGLTPPPPMFKTVSIVLSSDAQIQNGTALSKSSKELIVPEGYVFNNCSFSLSTIYENYPQMKFSIGANDLGWATLTNTSAKKRWDFQAGGISGYDGIIPVSINCYDINSFFINVTVNCIRTAAKYEQWQIQAFEKIMAAYKALQMDYEQKVAAQETIQGIAIQGQNPRTNREIEKTELKKQCIKMLMDTYLFGSFDALKDPGIGYPDFDIFDAFEEGKIIQFFEQAFEWENLIYLFYPYFWARKNQWVNKSNTYDTDPLFTKFLQAGSSRVVMPVHPAYNDAVMYFLENNGAIWKGGEPPRLNDPLYISLADELRNQTDDLAGALPEGDPWEVVLPTTLVYLQNDSVLPTF